ncbi:MAG: hypothetical protein JWO46_2230 [Nocardioidaceae bacterium]|nr:hypothetical protein [Nocardioidaceae bacterium]
MPEGLLLVLSDPVEGREPEFVEWYLSEHIPAVVAVPGFVAGTLARRVPSSLDRPEISQGFVATYETSVEVPVAAQRLMDAVGEGTVTLSPYLDQATLSISGLTPLG